MLITSNEDLCTLEKEKMVVTNLPLWLTNFQWDLIFKFVTTTARFITEYLGFVCREKGIRLLD